MFIRIVQPNLFLILNSVPVTFVTDSELIRPFVPAMTRSLDQLLWHELRRQESARLRLLEMFKQR
jgi:hypothetical protein